MEIEEESSVLDSSVLVQVVNMKREGDEGVC